MAPSPDKTAAVQRMQDYIEAHLGEPITIVLTGTVGGTALKGRNNAMASASTSH